MKIVNVDLIDNNKVLVSYGNGETAIYEASQLETLEPVKTQEGEPGFVFTHGEPVEPTDVSGNDGRGHLT